VSGNSPYASVGPTTNPFSQRVDGVECLDGSNLTPQSSLSPSHTSVHLPAYVKVARSGFDPKNAAFLERCGTLTVPEVSGRDELIRCFVLYIHPYMPVLHLQDFFDAVRQTENFDPLSLILLQAVLYAGCAYVDMPVLEALGFRTRIAARKTFYTKVKVNVFYPLQSHK
jgi:hypothetical protein